MAFVYSPLLSRLTVSMDFFFSGDHFDPAAWWSGWEESGSDRVERSSLGYSEGGRVFAVGIALLSASYRCSLDALFALSAV